MNLYSHRSVLARCGATAILLAVLLSASPGPVVAADTGAVANGDWSSAATWTNGVPGPADTAYIGSTIPAGAAATATVTLSQNTTAGIIFLGVGNNTAGTLDLGGFNLTAGSLYLGGGGAASLLRTGGATLSINGVFALSMPMNPPFSFIPTDSVGTLRVYGQQLTVTTVAAGNVTQSVAQISPSSTLNLGADLVVPGDISSQGTLNANGHALSAASIELAHKVNNRGPITTTDLTVNGVNAPQATTFDLTPADAITNFSVNDQNTTLPPGVTVQSLNLSVDQFSFVTPTARTSTAGNITRSASLSTGTVLNLGADLGLTGNLTVNGTLNANGHAISAATLIMVTSDGVPAPIQSDGLITVGAYNQYGARQRLTQPGDTLGSLLIASDTNIGGNFPVLTLGDAAGQMTGLTITGSAASAVSIDSLSRLTLEVNGQAGGWVLEWADPSGGDHIADLQALIAAGELTFSPLNGGSYSLSSDGAYTYVNVVPVPEPSALLLIAAAGGVGLWRLRKGSDGGVNALFMDSSVRLITNSIDQATWRALGTRNGGEVVDSTKY